MTIQLMMRDLKPYKEWKQWAKKEVKRRVARVWGKTKKMNVS